jgi:L-amino acid N-acyltransferase YncA
VTIEPLRPEHWDAVARIYAQGIATGHATFETEVPTWERWDASHLSDHRLVAVRDGTVTGWAALSPVSDRCVYGGVAEESVYVAEEARGRGVGRELLEALIAGAEASGIWTIQTGIFPENEASVRLHERVGFRIVGTRERLGQHNGVWRDVLLLERRSPIVGTSAPAGNTAITSGPRSRGARTHPRPYQGCLALAADECGLWLGARDPEAGQHYLQGH